MGASIDVKFFCESARALRPMALKLSRAKEFELGEAVLLPNRLFSNIK
jgi:hypothetical protein